MASPSTPRPLLVTGVHRSGTTWVGHMLDLTPATGYLNEPFTPGNRPRWLRGTVPCAYYYPGPEDAALRREVRRAAAFRWPVLSAATTLRSRRELLTWGKTTLVSARHRGRRALFKDPLALLAAPWFSAELDADVCVVVRHPAGFVSSVRRLGWRFDLRTLTDQPRLRADHLGPWLPAVERHLAGDRDPLEEAALTWAVLNGVSAEQAAAHPRWQVVRHEDLSDDPRSGFLALYAAFGLDVPAAASALDAELAAQRRAPTEVSGAQYRSIHRNSSAAAASWRRRLTADEVARVRAVVGEAAGPYADDAWW